jgi:tartrate-resistant acid phosphatase type 5
MVYFDNCDVIVNNSGIVAESATIDVANSLRPIYSVGKIGMTRKVPNGPVISNFRINYVPEIDNEPIYALASIVKAQSNVDHSGIRIELGGITGFNCYLTSYAVRAVPNEIVKASATFTTFTPLSGFIKQKKAGVNYNINNSIMHGWTTYAISSSGYFNNPTYEFNYELDSEWEPIYRLGSRVPREVKWMGSTERFTLVRDRFYGPTYSGEVVDDNLIEYDAGDSTVDFMNVALVCESNTKAVRFAAIGDYGKDSVREAAIASMVKSLHPNFIITLGDNNYEHGLITTIDANIGKHYAEFIGNYTGIYGPGASINRFYPCIGNHDATGETVTPTYADNYAPYLSYFTLPGNERYYDFIRGPVHFFCVNSDKNEPDGYVHGSTQAEWLKFRLSVSLAKWKVVYFHHPPFCSEVNYNSTWMNTLPLKTWGADVVMCGHAHIYERIERSGLLYLINGIGGNTVRQFGAPVDGSLFRYSGNHGAMLIDAEEDKMCFRLLTADKAVIDEYTLYKTGHFDVFCRNLNFNISGAIIESARVDANVDDLVRVTNIMTKHY